jgi:uncharacterized membrane protein
MNVSYSREQRREALRVYRRTGSVSKTILLLRVSACLCAEGLVYKYSANRLGYATAEVSGFLCVRLLL